MTAAALWPVQAAIYARLAADSTLVALLPGGAGAICDFVPADMPFPYIVLGDMQAQPLETQSTTGHDITLDIQAFSRGAGMKEAKALMAAVYACLHDADFTAEGHAVISCTLLSEECRLLADAETRQGIQRFRIITEPND